MKSDLGLGWQKVDLHVHTPASNDFDDKSVSASQIVAAAVEAGLDAIAITDHNSGAWIDRLAAAAKGHLTVFPGVEISCSGGGKGSIHVVALFDPSATTRTIEALLGALGFKPTQHGMTDAVTTQSPYDVISAIVEAGGLPILAHADSSAGVLSDMRGEPRTAVMNHPALAAVEVHDFPKYWRMLDGTDPNYRRKLPVYRSSDNRHPTRADSHSVLGIGTRFAHFKMGEVSLEGLRQCFADRDARIRSDDDPIALPQTLPPRVLSLTTSGGFFGGKELLLHPGLNSIIGGKGAGKSLIVEFLRFALDQQTTVEGIHEDATGKLQGCLGDGESVTVRLALASGRTIRVTRTYDGDANPLEMNYEDTAEQLGGSPRALFPIVAYSQNEAIHIARRSTAQLELIDGFIDLAESRATERRLITRLKENDKKLSEALLASESVAATERDLAEVTAQLAELEALLKSPKFDALDAQKPKTEALETLQAFAADLREELEQALDALGAIEAPTFEGQVARDPTIKALRASAKALVDSLSTALASAEKSLTRFETEVGTAVAKWEGETARAKAEHRKWLADAGGGKETVLGRRDQLAKRKTQLERDARAAKVRKDNATKLRADRRTLLDQFADNRTNRRALRQTEFDAIQTASGGQLEIELLPEAERSVYLRSALALKTGSRVREKDLLLLVERVHPRELVDLVVDNDVTTLGKLWDVTADAPKRLRDALASGESLEPLLAMQYECWPDDKPAIRYRKPNGKYYDLATLSSGQRCTALLLIALSKGTTPVVIDQPEDALDVPTVFSDVTMQLRRTKDSRQFILTTHNSTVGVSSDSDRFIVLEGAADTTEIRRTGAIDQGKVRDEVIQHLEGGVDSLQLKSKKYGPTSG